MGKVGIVSTRWIATRWMAAFLCAALLSAGLAACAGSGNPEEEQTRSAPTPTLYPAATSTPVPDSAGSEDRPPAASVSAPVSLLSTAVVSSSDSVRQSSGDQEVLGTPASESALSEGPPMASDQVVAAFEDVLNGIYERTAPSVVYIRVDNPAMGALRQTPSFPDQFLWGAGSGFVWDDEGHIVTNYHVVEDVIGETDEVTVIFADSTQAKATVLGSDPHSDLAVIKLHGEDRELQPVPLGDSSDVRVGQLSVAIGAPFGQEFTMTMGIVSAIGRNIRGQGQFTIPEVIQTDSAINPGNSGGPLLDSRGRVIGINTQIISDTGNYSGVGMAVPINIARRVVPSLIADGGFEYPWLGVSISSVDGTYAEELGLPEGTLGALVASVVDGSPADDAGLRGSGASVTINGLDYPAGGDVIIAIGSDEVLGSSDLIAHLTYRNKPGDTVTLIVLRDGSREEIEVTLGQRPGS